jgi:hypothetical protein
MVLLEDCFPKATGEICQCWHDEIAALPTFLFHLEQLLFPLKGSKAKLEENYLSPKEKRIGKRSVWVRLAH